MSEFGRADAEFLEFLVDDGFVDVEDDAAEVEDDVFDFCVHFCEKLPCNSVQSCKFAAQKARKKA